MKRDQSKNGDSLRRGFDHLREAQANLVQAMATLAQNQTAFIAEMREIERERREFKRESEERFHRIEAILELHTRLLESLSVKFEALPEAIREKMGFRAPVG